MILQEIKQNRILLNKLINSMNFDEEPKVDAPAEETPAEETPEAAE